MLLSLLKVVCIAVMGVGVHNTPTPISIKEDTENHNEQIIIDQDNFRIQKQNANNVGNYNYSTNLPFTIATASLWDLNPSSIVASDQVETRAFYHDPNNLNYYRLNTARRIAESNIAPYTIQMVQAETRVVNLYGNQSTFSTGLSTSNFYKNWNYGAFSTKITPQLPSVNPSITYKKHFNIGIYARNANVGTDRTAKIKFKTFIGNDEYIRQAHTGFLNLNGNATNFYNTLQQRVQNYQTYEIIKNLPLNVSPNQFKTYDIDCTATYNIATMNQNEDVYIIEFASVQLDNQTPDNFIDQYFDICWKYGTNSQPIYPFQQDNGAMMSTYISESNSTNIVCSFTSSYITATITTEVIDIPGMMFQILSMPFTFVSTAFNLTLFPGTQYSVNISQLLLSIFGILVFLFIFRLVLKK